MKKELRQMGPDGLVVGLALAAFPWVRPGEEWVVPGSTIALFFGIVMVSVNAFGREFGGGTFAFMLTQPVERRRLWRAKIGGLTGVTALIYSLFLASTAMRLMMGSNPANHWYWVGLGNLRPEEWRDWFLGTLLCLLVAGSSGLWSILLVRLSAAAFWISFLTPFALLLGLSLLFPRDLPDWLEKNIGLLALTVYLLAGFWLARRLFYRAQVVGWGGWTISLSGWRYWKKGGGARETIRTRRPWRALLKKEFQLQSISLFCAGSLLTLHIIVIVIRAVHVQFTPDSWLEPATDYFWAFWLVMPLIIGCTTVGEEHKLGVLPEQFCLPVSRWRQFLVKVLPMLGLGILFSGVMPGLLEGLAAWMGTPSVLFNEHVNGWEPSPAFLIRFAAFSLGGSLVATILAIYASSLARNFLHALGVVLAIIPVCAILVWLTTSHPWGMVTLIWGAPLLLILLLRLAYGNFKHALERDRFLRRNALGLAGGLGWILVLGIGTYNRSWEVFLPAEPAHGAPKLTMATVPLIRDAAWNGALIHKPGGQVEIGYWFNPFLPTSGKLTFRDFVPLLWNSFVNPTANCAWHREKLPGTNWVSLGLVRPDRFKGTNHFQGIAVAGIQTDGSLWFYVVNPERPAILNPPTRYGTASDWRQVTVTPIDVLLLKTNGTLWRLPCQFADETNNARFPWGSDAPSPQPIGSESDWADFLADAGSDRPLRKTDGTVWSRTFEKGLAKYHREPALDPVDFARADIRGPWAPAYVRRDGTLWFRIFPGNKEAEREYQFVQKGTDADWKNVICEPDWVIALKQDGTLWRWDRSEVTSISSQFQFNYRQKPERLGSHSDWVELVDSGGLAFSIAADGGMWLWPEARPAPYDNDRYFTVRSDYQPLLVRPPKQPQHLGNVLDEP